jgi:hypothetical protein
MRKRILLMILTAVLAISFSACGGSDQKTDTQPSGSSSTGLEWPGKYMSSLPAPDSKISSVEKLNGTDTIAKDDTTTQPSSVNVVMNEMTKKEALAYYDKLKNADFIINTDEKDSDKILLVGTLNDADKNPFLFGYSMADEMGNVSITILNKVNSASSSDSASGDQWPSTLLGDLPKPEYQTVTYKKGEAGSDFEGSVQVELTGMPDGDKYIKDLEAIGYSSLTNMKIGEAVNFIGQKDEDSTTVQVTYNYTTKECSIIYGSGK